MAALIILLEREKIARRKLTTTGNHDSIGSLKDFIIVLETLLVFNLADDFDVLAAIVGQELTKILHIGRLSHEASGNEINVVLYSKLNNVVDILFGKGGKIHNHTGKIHVLALSDGRVVFNAAQALSSCHVARQDGQHKGAIGHQNLLADCDRFRQLVVAASKLGFISLETVIRSQDDLLSLLQIDLVGSILEESRANLGSLGIQQNGYVLLLVLGGRSETLQDGTVTGVVTVRKVEAGTVHTGVQQSLQIGNTPARRADGADNLGATETQVGFLLDDGRQVEHATGKGWNSGRIGNTHDSTMMMVLIKMIIL